MPETIPDLERIAYQAERLADGTYTATELQTELRRMVRELRDIVERMEEQEQ